MPKIKDLGIKVIPETIQPPEVGGGGGCGIVACTVSPAAAARPCNPTFGCTDCTNQAYSICGTTPCGFFTCGVSPIAARACLPTAGCSDCTVQQFSICGTTPGGGCGFTCSDCTQQAFSICGTTPGVGCGATCSDCTVQPFSICGTTPHNCLPTFHPCLPTKCGCTFHATHGCGQLSLCGPGPSFVQQQPEVTVEQIAKMKDALKQQIAALEEAEKNLGPKTAEEIDARVKQLNDELAQLQARKKTLK